MKKKKISSYIQGQAILGVGKRRSNKARAQKRAYERYKKKYRELAEDYGNNMTQMMTFEDFITDYTKDIITSGGRAPNIGRYVSNQIFQTQKEARAGSRNIARHIDEIILRAETGARLSQFELELLKVVGTKRISVNDIRKKSARWQQVLDVLSKYGARDQIMGSK